MKSNNSISLVLLPGYMGKPSDFDSLIGHLSTEISPLPLDNPVNLEQVEDFESAVKCWYKNIEPLLPKRFWLMGYSQGGRIAMAIAKLLEKIKPSAIQGMILESANPGLQTEVEKQKRAQQDEIWIRKFSSLDPEPLLREWYEQPVFSSLTQPQKAQLISEKSQGNLTQYAQQMKVFGLANQPDYWGWLRCWSIPWIYVSGEKDRKFTEIGKNLSPNNHIVVPDAGHNIHYEKPSALARVINQFIDKRN